MPWLRSLPALLAAMLLPLSVGVHSAGAEARPEAPQAPPPLESPAANTVAQEVAVADLPPEARRTLALIRLGGPFPYRKDGSTFGNRERLLPPKRRGYYTEYTVPTPSSRDRGARRIVAGGNPALSDELYYTDDHYASFRKIREPMQ
jgi:ribonuclease T1